MTDQTIDGVPRELLEALVSIHPSDKRYRLAKEELRAMMDASDSGYDWYLDDSGNLRYRPEENTDVQPKGEPVAWRFRWDYDHGNGWCRNAVRFVESMEHVEHEDKSTWRDITPLYAEQPAPVEITLQQVLTAYEYAESHPHKYLRGTTNWCAAVAHSINSK